MAPFASKSSPPESDALPGKSGPSPMPYEIFLKIVDALVADAEDECEPILHYVLLHPSALTAPVVKPQDRHVHTDDLPIDPVLFRELANWERKYGNALFKKIAPTLEERGTKVYVFVSDEVEMDILELFLTPQGIRMRFLDPVCKCYKFHIPDSMKPNGGGRLEGKARRAAKAGQT